MLNHQHATIVCESDSAEQNFFIHLTFKSLSTPPYNVTPKWNASIHPLYFLISIVAHLQGYDFIIYPARGNER
jgi:hypothetical protein